MADLDYRRMIGRALLGVLREVLEQVARDGLPGEHHFYITFLTGAPGVRMPAFLRERYPEEMTIILQNQFWELEVEAEGFVVTLSFGGARTRMAIPFAAVRGFVDPAAEFGLQFEQATDETAGAAPATEEAGAEERGKPGPDGGGPGGKVVRFARPGS